MWWKLKNNVVDGKEEILRNIFELKKLSWLSWFWKSFFLVFVKNSWFFFNYYDNFFLWYFIFKLTFAFKKGKGTKKIIKVIKKIEIN